MRPDIKAIEERQKRLYKSDADNVYVEDYLADTEFLLNRINDLTTQLAEVKADYEAAVEDIKMIHDSGGDTCLACYHLDTNGECPFGWCNKSDEFRWRGRNKGNE